jgi:hypothetical protein
VTLPDNFLLTLEVRAEEQSGCYYGPIFHANLFSFEYYWFWTNGAEYRLVKRVVGQPALHADVVSTAQFDESTEVESLSVLARGAEYALFVNDTFLQAGRDDVMGGGYAGIGTRTCPKVETENPIGQYVFESFEVRAP